MKTIRMRTIKGMTENNAALILGKFIRKSDDGTVWLMFWTKKRSWPMGLDVMGADKDRVLTEVATRGEIVDGSLRATSSIPGKTSSQVLIPFGAIEAPVSVFYAEAVA